MGNFCDCSKKVDEEEDKNTAPTIDNSDRSELESTDRGAQYYQTIIDNAHRKFISATSRNRIRIDNGIEDLKARLSSATVDTSVFNTPHHKGGNPKSKIIDILSEPINVTSIDVVADELAELVSNHTFNFRMDDTNNSTVVSFKPVAGTQSSVGN